MLISHFVLVRLLCLLCVVFARSQFLKSSFYFTLFISHYSSCVAPHVTFIALFFLGCHFLALLFLALSHSTCCCSFYTIAFHMLLLLSHCCSQCCSFHIVTFTLFLLHQSWRCSCIVTFAFLFLHCSFHVVPFALHFLHCTWVLLLSHCNYALFFSRCYSSHIAILLALQFFSHYSSSPATTPLTLLLFSHCFSCLATPLTLPLPSHYFSCTIAHCKYMLAQPLLFFLCYGCYSFRVAVLFALLPCFVLLVWYFPYPCHVQVRLELQHQLKH